MTVLLAYLFYFIAASASPLQRRWLAVQNQEAPPEGQIHFAFQVVGILSVLGLLLLFFEPFKISGDPLKLVLLSLAAGLSGAGYFWASYVAQRHVEAGITTLLGNIYTPITIFLATVFLNETLTAWQMAGTVLLLAGVVVVSKKHRIGRFKFDRYFLLMGLSGVMLGLCLTAERALQVETGLTAATLFSWWSQFAVLGVLTLYTGSKSHYAVKDVAITGVLRFFQALSWVVLMWVVGNLSVVSAITTFKVVLIFIAGAILLNEREDMSRKILGSVIALAGLLLMK